MVYKVDMLLPAFICSAPKRRRRRNDPPFYLRHRKKAERENERRKEQERDELELVTGGCCNIDQVLMKATMKGL